MEESDEALAGDPHRQVRDLQEELSKLRSLQEHPGWKTFLELANAIKVDRIQHGFKRLNSIEEVLGEQYDKGIVAGVNILQNHVAAYCQDLQEEINQRLKEEGEKDERNSADYGERERQLGLGGELFPDGGAP